MPAAIICRFHYGQSGTICVAVRIIASRAEDSSDRSFGPPTESKWKKADKLREEPAKCVT